MVPAAPVPHIAPRYQGQRRTGRLRRAWVALTRPAPPDREPRALGALAQFVMLSEAAGTAVLDRTDLTEAITGDLVDLDESPTSTAGLRTVKVMDPGWGASGYYPADVIQRDGPTIFPAGTHMYFDHPTLDEAAARPERSLRDLAGVTTKPAAWNPAGAAGPGLYTEAKVVDAYRPLIDQMAPHIGVSIRALGEAAKGEAEGRKGLIVHRMVEGRSIDFVTKAGRGGQVLPLLEAARADVQIERTWKLDDLTEADRTWSDTEDMVADEIRDQMLDSMGSDATDCDRYTYVRAIADTWVVWRDTGDTDTEPGLYRASYQIDDANNAVTIGTPEKVVARTTYEPAPEQPEPAAAPPVTSTTPMQEATVPATTPTAQELQESNTQLTTQLAEANTATARATEQLVERDARDHIAGAIAKVTGLPAAPARRLAESLSAQAPPTADGKLDVTKLDETIAAAVKAEVDYLTEMGVGQVKGLGGGTSPLTEAAPTGDAANAALEASFKELGLSESAAKTAATGR